MISDIKKGKTIYYDDGCNLCNASIRFIRRFEKKCGFDFIPLRYSEFRDENTVIFSEKGKIYSKSDAILRIIKQLHWTVSWMYAFVLVPRSIRNSVYDFISRNRIRWFGKYKNQVSGSRTQDNVTK